MKLALLTGLALGVCVAAQAADPLPASDPTGILKTDAEKFSYSIGLNLGNQVRMQLQGFDVSTDMIIRGLKDGLTNQPLMTPQEIQAVQTQVRTQLMALNEQRMTKAKVANLAEADKFLAENAKKEGVKSTPGGVQYKVLKEGTGPKPKISDRVAVHYRGTLLNGTEFDASMKRSPEPWVTPVTGVIKGWTEALTNMNVGSKWELYIPALAYGEGGTRGIEPNSALIFEVELLDIKQPEPPPQPITSDIIKVPSKAELDAGAQIETIKPEDLAKYTNKPAAKPAPAPK